VAARKFLFLGALFWICPAGAQTAPGSVQGQVVDAKTGARRFAAALPGRFCRPAAKRVCKSVKYGGQEAPPAGLEWTPEAPMITVLPRGRLLA
jgi:hypothetical protein